MSKDSRLPILKYAGGKHREIPQYLSYIPDYDKYFEPFFGGGATYFYIQPDNARVADINEPLIHFYKSFVKEYPRFRQELDTLQSLYESNNRVFKEREQSSNGAHVENPNAELYYDIRSMFNGLSPAKYCYATIYYFINKLAYSGMIRYNKAGEFNVPFGHYHTFNTHLVTKEQHDLMEKAEIANESYQRSFELAGTNDFIFLDPPYDTTFSEYGNEVLTGDFNEDSHRQLAEDFKNLSAKALMIIGKTDLISELYRPYIQGAYEKRYSVNIRNRFKSTAQHLIIANYKLS